MLIRIRLIFVVSLAAVVVLNLIYLQSMKMNNVLDVANNEPQPKANDENEENSFERKAPSKLWLEFEEFQQKQPPQEIQTLMVHGFPLEEDWLLSSNDKPWNKNDTIPKIMNKLYISNSGEFEKIFNVTSPDLRTRNLQKAHASWKQHNPGYRIRYFNLHLMREYLKTFFHPVFLRAFDCMEAYSSKTNLFRYAVVYRDGGWHSDWKQECLVEGLLDNLVEGNTTWFATDDKGAAGCHQTAIFGASPRHPVLVATIKVVMSHVQKQHYGASPLHISGPCVLSEGYKNAKNKMNIGNTKFGTYRANQFTYKDVVIVRHKCKGCGDSQNWNNGNNYNDKYKKKEAYCPEAASLFDPSIIVTKTTPPSANVSAGIAPAINITTNNVRDTNTSEYLQPAITNNVISTWKRVISHILVGKKAFGTQNTSGYPGPNLPLSNSTAAVAPEKNQTSKEIPQDLATGETSRRHDQNGVGKKAFGTQNTLGFPGPNLPLSNSTAAVALEKNQTSKEIPQDLAAGEMGRRQDQKGVLSSVLVEIRCHKGLLIVMQQSMRHLHKHNIQLTIWHSAYNEFYIKNLKDADPFLKESYERNLLVLRLFDPSEYGFNESSNSPGVRYEGSYWYQRFMKSSTFWDNVPTKWILTLQTDSLLCRPVPESLDNLETIMYLGGPSGFTTVYTSDGGNSSVQRMSLPLIPSDKETRSHLNAGLSLHNVAWTKECIKNYKNQNGIEKATEDELWNYCRLSSSNSSGVTELQAYSFASDHGHTKCFSTADGKRICPFGVHKPWTKKMDGDYKELVANCPGLEKLESLQGMFVNKQKCLVFGMEKAVYIPCSCGR